MPFDPADFSKVADEVARRGTEAALRTAVGRAYYAILMSGWLQAAKSGRQRRKVSHQMVEKAARNAGLAVGQQFVSLLRLRVEADYYMEPSDQQYSDWNENWERARFLSNALLHKVDQFSL